MSEHWRVERRESFVILTFARPPQNTMSFLALGELDRALTAIATDPAVSVVVLTGGLPGYFVAHADLDDVGRMSRGEAAIGDPRIYRQALQRLEAMPQPTVAAVNGQAWGGGCELALACTFRLLARTGHFRLLEVSKGAIPGAGGTQRLPRLIGLGAAARVILSSCLVQADEALALGLADAVLPDENFLEHALGWLRSIAEQPRHALFAAKQAIMQGLHLPFDGALDNEQRLFLEAVTGPGFTEEPQ